MADDPHPSGSDETLAEVFWGVAGRLRRQSKQQLAAFDITPGQARATAVLVRHGPMRLSDLAEHLHIAPRSATEVVDALVEHGLAERRPDPHDRRAVTVALTAAGERVTAQVRAARSSEADAFFGRLSERDYAALLRILRKLRD